jgi:hypothetical protein
MWPSLIQLKWLMIPENVLSSSLDMLYQSDFFSKTLYITLIS